jgi:hypothetical protein
MYADVCRLVKEMEESAQEKTAAIDEMERRQVSAVC